MLQIFALFDVQFLQCGGDVLLHRVGGDAQMACNFLIGPAPGGQYAVFFCVKRSDQLQEGKWMDVLFVADDGTDYCISV